MEIPVFCYHNAIAESLEKDLAFLATNGYRTLRAAELVDVLGGALEPPPKPVALTFDDGLLSVLTVGLPLLEQFDAVATIFAITGLVEWGRAETSAAGAESRLLGWDDLREMRDSGRIEVGSHGHRHNPVHIAAQDGAPFSVSDYGRLYDVPVAYSAEYNEASIRAADGKPKRPSAPLFAAQTVLVGDDETEGGSVLAEARPLVVDDLEKSAALLRQELGAERLHLCLPYGAGSEQIPGLAGDAGFESVFWSRRDDRSANAVGDDPLRIVRSKHDFLRRLPGKGRRSLADVGIAKVVRRITSDPWD